MIKKSEWPDEIVKYVTSQATFDESSGDQQALAIFSTVLDLIDYNWTAKINKKYFNLQTFRMKSVYVPRGGLVGELFPAHLAVTFCGKLATCSTFLPAGSFVSLTVRLHGGKGGYGQLLKDFGKETALSRNKKSMRDLSGNVPIHKSILTKKRSYDSGFGWYEGLQNVAGYTARACKEKRRWKSCSTKASSNRA